MKLTTKGRYAVMALTDLARFNLEGPVSLRDISLRQGISILYLEQIFLKLKNKNIVHSVRGANGGYKLIKEPSKIKLSEIFNAVDEEGEGEILFHDFLTLMVVLMENDTEELNLINAFEIIDEKNSGLISVEHVRNILTTIGEQMTTKEIEKFIENTDLDNDGMVSINDIQRMLA